MTLVAAPTRTRRSASAPREPKAQPPPFTLPHFRAWAADLILDTGESWHLDPFQEAFVEDHFAGFAEAWLVVPEGNGKTTLIGGIGLYHCEHREYANVPVAASSREQAEIMYRQMEGFVLRSPRLYEMSRSEIAKKKGKLKIEVPRFVCLEGYRRINHFGGGRIQIMAADDRTGDGGIPTLAILDELHRHRDLSLYRTWAGKLVKRQGQLIAISTAGEPSSEFEQTRQRIRQSAADISHKGSFTRAATSRVVLHEWAVAEDGDVEDMAVVKAANPFGGVTRALLEEKFASPTMTLNHWRRFVCNVPTRAENAAITESEWDRAKVTDAIPVGEHVDLGLDVAWKWDTTSAVPLWSGPEYRLLGPATILTPPRDGSSLDPYKVKSALTEIHDRNPVDTLVMDISRAEELAAWAEETIGCVVIDRGTSNQFAAQDYERFMDGLRTGKLKHTGDLGLTKHAMNAIARDLPSGDARFDRPMEARISAEQERRVIDALSAASMVHGVVAGQEPEVEAVPLVAWR